MSQLDRGEQTVKLGEQIDTNWFRGRLVDRQLSQRQLAKLMGLDPSALSLMLRGKRRLSAQEAAELAVQLGVSADEVLMRAGSAPTLPERRAERRAERAPVVTGQEWQAVATTPVAAPSPVVDAAMIELPVPMSDGSTARLLLPRAMGRDDAARIAAVVQALALPLP